MAARTKIKELDQAQSLAASANKQLTQLHDNLGKAVTATGTLNEELSDVPTPAYVQEVISKLGTLRGSLQGLADEWQVPTPRYIQEVVSDLDRLRKELHHFVEPDWEIPSSDDLERLAEAASTLAVELVRVKQIWDELPSDEELEAKANLLAQVGG